jgi:hypothetical protein
MGTLFLDDLFRLHITTKYCFYHNFELKYGCDIAPSGS